MIFDRIGSLSSEDFSFLSEESAIAYADQVYKQRLSMIMQHPKDDQRKRLQKSGCPQAFIDLLEGLLQFNQLFRLSAADCLKHTYFDDIREPEKEIDAPYEINLTCDGIDYYDYETNKDNFCSAPS